MKKILFLFIALVTLVSCSSNEELHQEQNLLKSYKVSKDAQGQYSIDYTTVEATVDLVNDLTTKRNEIYLNSAASKNSVESFSNALFLDENELKVGIYENNMKRKTITIEDDNIVLAKGGDDIDFLKTYSIENLGNEYYQLSFKVKDGIKVWFEYNEELDVYEIHLQENDSASNLISYTRNFVKTSDSLKINFVNYIKPNYAKGVKEYVTERKPKLVVM